MVVGVCIIMIILRVLSECLMLIESTMFDATFNLATRVGLPIFGTMKDGSLEISSLAFNNCFIS